MSCVSVYLFGASFVCARFMLNVFVKNRLCFHGVVVNPRISCLPFRVSYADVMRLCVYTLIRN